MITINTVNDFGILNIRQNIYKNLVLEKLYMYIVKKLDIVNFKIF